MAPSGDKHIVLVQRIKSARAALHGAAGPDTRSKMFDELGAAPRQLAELILQARGPFEKPARVRAGRFICFDSGYIRHPLTAWPQRIHAAKEHQRLG